jgi:hypothetical protein
MQPALPVLDDVEQRIVEVITSHNDISCAVRRRNDRPVDRIEDDNAAWSNVLLNAILDLGHERGFNVFPRRLYFGRAQYAGNSKYDQPRRSDDRGEYLFDACWTTYPTTATEWLARLRHGPIPEPRIALACESEWVATVRGSVSSTEHVAAVLDDFAKLTDVGAPLKVLLYAFGTEDGATSEEIVTLCASAAGAIQVERPPPAGYALLGWPLGAGWGTLPTTRYLTCSLTGDGRG